MDDWVKVQLYKLFLILFMLWIGLDAVYGYFLGRSPLAWGGLTLMFVGFVMLAFSAWNITQFKFPEVNLKMGTISATLYSAGFVMNLVSKEYQMWFVFSFSLVFVLFVVVLIVFSWRREAKRKSYTAP